MTDLLTIRELEVAKLKAEGETNKQIAKKLGIADRTVHAHIDRVYRKLGINSVALLTKWAIASGLVNLQ